ncbi:hypothetical protein C1645_826886 [Glomus cerebriforme]|uniref:Uncharacterized protein n=1 Tax=Glomus cerebriforme TaxID=658196 RepID=A0A397SPP4_9GLOM|nr:hypothetical protein C1645_826886 [Glomus cerebriforme]
MFRSCDVEVKLNVFDDPPGEVRRGKLWSEEVKLHPSIASDWEDNCSIRVDPWLDNNSLQLSALVSFCLQYEDEIGILLDAVALLWTEGDELWHLLHLDCKKASLSFQLMPLGIPLILSLSMLDRD